jgi:hypothetical protein
MRVRELLGRRVSLGSRPSALQSDRKPILRISLTLLCLLLLAGNAARAEPIPLLCSGNARESLDPKYSAAKEVPIGYIYLMFDLDKRTVVGFWEKTDGIHDTIKIIDLETLDLTFQGTNNMPGEPKEKIDGLLYRMSGKLSADEAIRQSDGTISYRKYDLICKRATPVL